MKIGKFEILFNKYSYTEYDWLYILPSLEYKHKAWYIWQFVFSWLKWSFSIEIIDTSEQIEY
jgi:hypothetical protein